MSVAIAPRLRNVSADRSQGKRLQVVPILGPSHDEPNYELLRQETYTKVIVTEVSEAGSVPELKVENTLDVRVFLMDGQELVGAKQNRILNTDVLVPAHKSVNIPVSCVEHGRWRQVSEQFHSGKAASHRTRSAKIARVHESLRAQGSHDADQGAVWNEVAESLSASKAHSPTMALSDAYALRQLELESFRRDLRLPERAVGIAIFRGGQFQGLDLFDRHSTLKYFWDSLVDSYTLDLLADSADQAASPNRETEAIASILNSVSAGRWERFDSPGEGADWRLDDAQYAASSTIWEEKVVLHLQVFPKTTAASREATYRPRIRRNFGRVY